MFQEPASGSRARPSFRFDDLAPKKKSQQMSGGRGEAVCLTLSPSAIPFLTYVSNRIPSLYV